MQLKENRVEALIGAAVLVVAGLFVSYAYTRTEAGQGAGGYTLNARFDSAGGLSVGTDVRISGIKVGTVTAQSLDPENYKAVISFTVRDDVKLPADSTAVVASEGLLGGNYLELKPGYEEDLLKPGATVLYTQGSLDILGLVGRFIGNTDKPADKKDTATPASPVAQ